MTTLEDFYYGNIIPHENPIIKGSEYDMASMVRAQTQRIRINGTNALLPIFLITRFISGTPSTAVQGLLRSKTSEPSRFRKKNSSVSRILMKQL